MIVTLYSAEYIFCLPTIKDTRSPAKKEEGENDLVEIFIEEEMRRSANKNV
jgi:hypothetical protein